MLFRVFMEDTFADEPDRIGIIEAGNIEQAVARLLFYNTEGADWGAYSAGAPSILYVGDTAKVSYPVEDESGTRGTDSYIVAAVAGDILMLLAEDWRLVFR